jgi:hypothetical protein
MQFETINGLIPFELKGDQGKFEDAYTPYFIEKGLSEKDALDVVSSIWLFVNDQWSKGKEYGEHNSVAGEFVELEDNFVPNAVLDPYQRKHIRHRFNIKQGQTREQVQTALEQYIKEYIEKNTVYHSPQFISEFLPPEPAVLPSIQIRDGNGSEVKSSLEYLKEDILSCKDLKILESYKLIVKAQAELQSVYDKRMEQLKNYDDRINNVPYRQQIINNL